MHWTSGLRACPWHLQRRGTVGGGVSLTSLIPASGRQREMVSAFWMSQGNVMRSCLKTKQNKQNIRDVSFLTGCCVDDTCIKNYKARFIKYFKDLNTRRHQEMRTEPGLQWLRHGLDWLCPVLREHQRAHGSAHKAGFKRLWVLMFLPIRRYLSITV